jgi:hypothetical protein
LVCLVGVFVFNSFSSSSAQQSIAAGSDHYLAIKDGKVYAWGNNDQGQLGLGDKVQRATPTLIQGMSGVTQIKADNKSSMALLSDGTIRVWGAGVTIPTRDAAALTGVIRIAGTDRIITTGGRCGLQVWDYSLEKNVGVTNVVQAFNTVCCPYTYLLKDNGDVTNRDVYWWYSREEYVESKQFGGARQIGINTNTLYTIMNDKTVQLFDVAYGISPTTISGLSNVKQLSIKPNNLAFLLENGTVKVTTESGATPSLTTLTGVTDANEVCVGLNNNMVIRKDDGSVQVYINRILCGNYFSTEIVPNKWYRLVMNHSGKCLRPTNGAAGGGAQLEQWTVTYGELSQLWRFQASTVAGYWTIFNKLGEVMDVNATTLRAPVSTWAANDGDNQMFKLSASPISDYFFITDLRTVNAATNLTLTISDVSIADGADIIMYTKKNNNYNNQLVKCVEAVFPDPSKWYKIVIKNDPTICLDDYYQHSDSLGVWSYSGGQNQQWKFVKDNSGFYTITNRQTGKSIDIPNGNSTSGTKLIAYTTNSGDNQKWNLIETNGGYYRLAAKSNPTLGLNSLNGTNLGNRVGLWNFAGGDNEQWIFSEVE